MTTVFSYAFNAVAPILLLVMLGYALKQKGIVSADFFQKLNSFVFHYSFPFLMFYNLYQVESVRELDYRLAFFLVGSIAVLTIVSVLIANRITEKRSRKGVMIQAGYRSNFALIGIPLIEGLVGSQGVFTASSMQAPIVIYYNFFSVLFLAIYGDSNKVSVKNIVKNLIKNPLIQGLSAGIVVLLLREIIPVNANGEAVFSIKRTLPWAYNTVSYLGRVATPMSLISLGGQFHFSTMSGMKKELCCAVFMKLILAPAIGFSLAALAARTGFIALTPAAVGTMIACFGSPLAVSAVPMATEMGGDAELAGQIVVWTSWLSMFTIFFMVVLFRTIGIL